MNDVTSDGKGTEDATDFVQRLQPAMTDAEFAEESKRRELIGKKAQTSVSFYS